jgi:hypothetical protein
MICNKGRGGIPEFWPGLVFMVKSAGQLIVGGVMSEQIESVVPVQPPVRVSPEPQAVHRLHTLSCAPEQRVVM